MEGMNPTPAPVGAELILGGGRHFLIVDGKIVEQSIAANDQKLRKPQRAPKEPLSNTEAKKEINRILSSDLEQARKIVLGDKPADTSIDLADSRKLMQPLGNRILIGGADRNLSFRKGVTVELGERWKGNAKDLGVLAEVSNLTEVKLSTQSLNNSILEPIAAIKSLNKLVFEQCEFSAKNIKNIKWPKSIKEIELANHTLGGDLISSFRSFPSASLLTFRECKLEQGAEFNVLKNLKTLRGLEFQGLDISEDLFESFGELRQLTYINLAYCKFKTSDYKALKKLRPNLQISYTAKAFLGVRGPIDMGQVRPGIGGCVVSEVIPGSGAFKGGIKVHDVIERINGQKVEVFEDLRLHIAQHRPGEKLDVTVNRLGKSLDLEIELSSFDEDLQ